MAQTVYEYLNSVLLSGNAERISEVFSKARQQYSSQFGERNCTSILINLSTLNSTIEQLRRKTTSGDQAQLVISTIVESLFYYVKNSTGLQNLYIEENISVPQVPTEASYPPPTITVINTYLRKLQDFIDPAGSKTYLEPKAVKNVFIPILNWYNQITGNCFPEHPYLNEDFPSADAAKSLVEKVIIPHLEKMQKELVQTETTVRACHYISEFRKAVEVSIRKAMLEKAAELMELDDRQVITDFMKDATLIDYFNPVVIKEILKKYEN